MVKALPQLLPRAAAWAEAASVAAIAAGAPLTPDQRADALAVGVQQPDKVRIVVCDDFPRPDSDAELLQAATAAGLLGPGATGMTLGYAVFIRTGAMTRALLTHECRHVHQFEVAGSISEFLAQYLPSLLTHGYRDCPFEIDARQHELYDE